MLTEGKRMTVEEYSPNVQSSSNSNSSVVVHPPPSPLSEAIKRSKITLTPDDQYLIKANSGKIFFIIFKEITPSGTPSRSIHKP